MWLWLWMGLSQAAEPEDGKAIYIAKCQACHGPLGQGDGPASKALPQKPPDLSTPAFWVGKTNDQLKVTIRTGKPGSIMRGFPMSDEQMNALLVYLRTLEQPASGAKP